MISKIFKTSLFRSAGVYALSNIVSSAIPFLLIPILTRYLSPEDYGVVSMFQVAAGVVSPFISLSIHGAIGRQYVDKSREELAEYIGNCLLLMLLTVSVTGVMIFALGDEISNLSSIQKDWLWTILIFVASQTITQILLVLWQMQNRTVSYACLSMVQTLLNAGLTVTFIVGYGWGWQGRIGAQVVTSALFSLVSLSILFRNNRVSLTINKAYLLSALSFGAPLIPHALGGWATEMIDRVFITNLVGVADTGVYSVGYQVGMIIGIIEASFVQAWVPYLYNQLKDNSLQVKQKLVRFTYFYCLGLVLLALALSVASHLFLPYFVGSRFAVAQKYIIWIALGYAFSGMYKMMAGYFFYFEKTRVLAVITALSAVVNVLLTYCLVRRFGTSGAAYATTLSYLLTFLLTWALVNKVNKMPWFKGRRCCER